MTSPSDIPLADDELEAVLDCEMVSDYETTTVRLFLRELLKTLWHEGSNFNSKRPYGTSDWQWNVYDALVKNSLISGRIDTDGEVVDCSTKDADRLILRAIDYLWMNREEIINDNADT